MFTPAGELLTWLNAQRPADEAGRRRLLTLRWLVFGELERSGPEPVPKSITHFVPDEPSAQLNILNDLTSGPS